MAKNRKKSKINTDDEFQPNYPSRLWGFGVQTLSNPRGFKGGTKCGPANQGRKLSRAEKRSIEAELRKKGII